MHEWKNMHPGLFICREALFSDNSMVIGITNNAISYLLMSLSEK